MKGTDVGDRHLTEPEHKVQLWVFVPTIMLLGPYLGFGMRAEHAVIVGLLFILAIWELATEPAKFIVRPSPSSYIAVMLVPVVVALISSIVQPRLPEPLVAFRGSLLASLDNALLPVAVVVLAWLWLRRFSHAETLLSFTLGLMWAGALNAILALVSFFSRDAIAPLLGYFWGSDEYSRQKVLGKLEVNERLSGVFSQPSEAGIYYSVAILLGCYLVASRQRTGGAAWLLPILVLGGLLTESKIFLLGGLPLALAVVMLGSESRWKVQRLASVLLVFCALALVASAASRLVAGAMESFGRIFSQPLSLDALSGGRIGQDRALVDYWEALWSGDGFLFGYGIEVFGVSSDSEFVRVMGNSGALGLLLLAVFFALLSASVIRSWHYTDPATRTLAVALIGLAVGASAGIPALSANRAGSALVMSLALVVMMGNERRTRNTPQERSRRRSFIASPQVSVAGSPRFHRAKRP